MSDIDDIEESIKNKLEGHEFPFDESNWDKARNLIDESRKKKRRAIIILLSTAFAGMLSICLFFYNNKQYEPGTILANNTVPVPAKNEINSSVVTESLPGKNNRDLPESNVKKPVDIIRETTSGPREVQSLEQKNTPLIQDRKKISNETVKVLGESIKKTSTSHPSVASTKQKENRSYPGYSVKAVASASKSKNPGKHFAMQKIAGAGTNKIPLLEKQNLESTPIQAQAENKTKNTESPGLGQSLSEDFSEAVFLMEPVAIAFISETAYPDLMNGLIVEVLAGKELIVPASQLKNIIYIEAGADYLMGWKNSSSTEANGFNPIAGLTYQRLLTKKITGSIGMQYNSIGNLINSSYTSTVTTYGFGVESNVTTITQKKLHYLVVPLKIGYKYRQSVFGLGCNIAYLVNANDKIETYTEIMGQRTNSKISETTGYRNGFNSFDTQLSLFYKRTLYKRFSLNAELLYGLTDTKNNTFFKSNYFERNTGLKLTLCYDLFKR